MSAHASMRNGCAWRSSISKVSSVQGYYYVSTAHDVAAVDRTTYCARNTNNLPESWAAVTKRRSAHLHLHPRKRYAPDCLFSVLGARLLNVQRYQCSIVVPENRSTSGVHALPSLSSRPCRSTVPEQSRSDAPYLRPLHTHCPIVPAEQQQCTSNRVFFIAT